MLAWTMQRQNRLSKHRFRAPLETKQLNVTRRIEIIKEKIKEQIECSNMHSKRLLLYANTNSLGKAPQCCEVGEVNVLQVCYPLAGSAHSGI